jgi:hypothetical protein
MVYMRTLFFSFQSNEASVLDILCLYIFFVYSVELHCRLEVSNLRTYIRV